MFETYLGQETGQTYPGTKFALVRARSQKSAGSHMPLLPEELEGCKGLGGLQVLWGYPQAPPQASPTMPKPSLPGCCEPLRCASVQNRNGLGVHEFPRVLLRSPRGARDPQSPGWSPRTCPHPRAGGGGAGISVFRGCLKHFCSEMQRLGVVLRGYRLDKPPFSQIPKLVFLSFTLGTSLPFYHSSIALGAAIIYLDRLKVYLFGNCLVS